MTPTSSLTLYLDHQVNRWLVRARADDGVPASERIRAGLWLWHTQPEMTEKVNTQAAALRRTPHPPAADARVKLRIALSPQLRQALINARADDLTPASVRVRAVLQLWHDDPAVGALIDTTAAQLRRSRLVAAAGTPQIPLPTAVGA